MIPLYYIIQYQGNIKDAEKYIFLH